MIDVGFETRVRRPLRLMGVSTDIPHGGKRWEICIYQACAPMRSPSPGSSLVISPTLYEVGGRRSHFTFMRIQDSDRQGILAKDHSQEMAVLGAIPVLFT